MLAHPCSLHYNNKSLTIISIPSKFNPFITYCLAHNRSCLDRRLIMRVWQVYEKTKSMRIYFNIRKYCFGTQTKTTFPCCSYKTNVDGNFILHSFSVNWKWFTFAIEVLLQSGWIFRSFSPNKIVPTTFFCQLSSLLLVCYNWTQCRKNGLASRFVSVHINYLIKFFPPKR